jgi:N-acetylglucosaminyl-diphospho-decaprenol L-rhamnosyltransferase
MEPTPDLSIIIVNWRSVDYLRPCLASLEREIIGLRYEVVVIDNASGDGCGKMLAQEFPKSVFIQSEKNLGFPQANNVAVQRARGRVLLFLNPDTVILGRAVNELYAEYQKLPKAGVLGCRLLNTDRTLQTSCVQSFPTILNQLLSADLLRRAFPRSKLWGMRALFDPEPKVSDVDAISGACMMIERARFERVGGFSTDYFMYAEDIDLCYKLRQAGLRNYYFSGAHIIHHGGGSSRQSSAFANAMLRESAWRYFRKYHGKLAAGSYRLSVLAVAGSRLALLSLGAPFLVLSGRRGFWSNGWLKWLSILSWAIGVFPKRQAP